MTFYAVFDTNVIVSALITKNNDSPFVKVVDAIINREIMPVYNQEIIHEYTEVLERPKFSLSKERVNGMIQLIKQFGQEIYPKNTGVVLPDMDDLVFYEVVMGKRETNDNAYLITGNIKHFPKKWFIVTPAEMMDILNEK